MTGSRPAPGGRPVPPPQRRQPQPRPEDPRAATGSWAPGAAGGPQPPSPAAGPQAAPPAKRSPILGILALIAGLLGLTVGAGAIFLGDALHSMVLAIGLAALAALFGLAAVILGIIGLVHRSSSAKPLAGVGGALGVLAGIAAVLAILGPIFGVGILGHGSGSWGSSGASESSTVGVQASSTSGVLRQQRHITVTRPDGTVWEDTSDLTLPTGVWNTDFPLMAGPDDVIDIRYVADSPEDPDSRFSCLVTLDGVTIARAEGKGSAECVATGTREDLLAAPVG